MTEYGTKYYCVTFLNEQKDREIVFLMADNVEVKESGTVVFWRENGAANFIVAGDKLLFVYSASVVTGDTVAVESWDTEEV